MEGKTAKLVEWIGIIFFAESIFLFVYGVLQGWVHIDPVWFPLYGGWVPTPQAPVLYQPILLICGLSGFLVVMFTWRNN